MMDEEKVTCKYTKLNTYFEIIDYSLGLLVYFNKILN